MTEIYHYHDNTNIEYKQRILLNKASCIFCEIDKKDILVQCKECDRLFCNGKNANPKSHIIFHLQKSSHKIISIYPFDKIIQCEDCTDNNIFNLYFLKTSDKIKIMCKNHISKKDEEKVIPFVGENNQLSAEVVPPPTREEDIKKLKDTTIIEMDKRENLIEDLNYVANRFLNKVKDKYDDKEQYYCIYKPLILCELEYARKICESKKSYQIRIIGTGKQHKNKPLFKFIFNRSHERPFKIGNIYHFKKENSKTNLTSLGLLVKINRQEYQIVPMDKKRDIFEEGIYTVKEEFCSVPYDRMIAALDIFFDDSCFHDKISYNLTNYILGKKDKNFDEKVEVSSLLNPFSVYEIRGYGKLNPSQKNAINSTSKHVLNLIQGPPGTGKTFTASFLIYNILLSRKNIKQKILVCAPTNAAADNISLSLLNLFDAVSKNDKNAKKFKILRIVARTREYIDYDEKVQEISLQNLIDFEKENHDYETKQIISLSDIVVTTCSTSMIDKLEGYNFKFVVIDEITQSQEAETLLPMLKGSRHVTLIGDPQQLSPTVLHPKGKQTGMHISLFERIMKLNPENNVLLETQYRMHPKIAEFISNTFYEGKLENGLTKEERTNKVFNKDFGWPNKDFPIVFINVEGKDKISTSGTSYINESECLTLIKIIQKKFPLIERKNTCIITPYLGQKELLEYSLFENNINIEVSSVDSFQGQERDFIIINTVRNNPNCEIGFLKDVKRLNVSISRAKYGLIIIGNANCLYNAKIENKYSIWKKYIEYIKDNNALVSYNSINNTFEKFGIRKQLIKEGKENENEDDNYEEKYDYDGSKNNYNSNWDLINKDSGESVNNKFYYNSINKNENKNKNRNKKRGKYRNNRNYYYNYYSYSYSYPYYSWPKKKNKRKKQK